MLDNVQKIGEFNVGHREGIQSILTTLIISIHEARGRNIFQMIMHLGLEVSKFGSLH